MLIKRIPTRRINIQKEWIPQFQVKDASPPVTLKNRQHRLLIVEGPIAEKEDKYILISGYDIYEQEKAQERSHLYCLIQEKSHFLRRTCKVLYLELRLREYTGLSCGHLIYVLLSNGYSLAQISMYSHVPIRILHMILHRYLKQVHAQIDTNHTYAYPIDFMEYIVYIPGILSGPDPTLYAPYRARIPVWNNSSTATENS